MFELFFIAMQEIAIAATGGDWGHGALSELLGNDSVARMIVNTVAR